MIGRAHDALDDVVNVREFATHVAMIEHPDGPQVMPALKVKDFNLTSLSDAVSRLTAPATAPHPAR